jgi:tRNA (cmo5U34)-methyltransferase
VDSGQKRDRVFAEPAARAGDFVFDTRVAEVFDDMVVRSIPLYLEQQSMVTRLAKRLWVPDTDVYDLGCSTATTLIGLCREIGGSGRFVGYDSSEPMLERARAKVREHGLDQRIELRCADLNQDPGALPLHNASVVTMCWTLQFVRPLHRDALIRRIAEGLIEHGALLVTEKILATHPRLNPCFVELYHQYKRQNEYSEEEIVRKREALENVLVPYSIGENLELFRRNGFVVVETFFQWFNFAGFLCLKRA